MDLLENRMSSHHKRWPRCQPWGLTFPISRAAVRSSIVVVKQPEDAGADAGGLVGRGLVLPTAL